MASLFRDRRHAGLVLGDLVRRHLSADGATALVLGIPRGGVVVASEVARALGAELDLAVPRKLRAPYNPELAVGAVAEDGSVYVDERVTSSLRVPPEYLQQEVAFQLEEIRRRLQAYRQDRPAPQVSGRTVVLVDDGIATGSTMEAALAVVLSEKPRRVVVAVPVASPDAVERLKDQAEVVVLSTPPDFAAVGAYFMDFGEVTDEEVEGLLLQWSA